MSLATSSILFCGVSSVILSGMMSQLNFVAGRAGIFRLVLRATYDGMPLQ